MSLTSSCSTCGSPISPAQRFCGQCGALLTDVASPEKFGSPQAYTPRHLAERILGAKSALEGERKQVTVLFADLKASMELLADRDPEEARKILDPVVELMMEAVHRYEGTVNQVLGDGIMALFGAPLAHEDHAVHACYAALRMQDSVRRYAEGVRRHEGVTIQMRVGLNSGEVLVRSIGSDLRMEYSVVGQTTHLASRMERLAEPGSILVTADTLHLAEGYVAATALGQVKIRGLSDAMEVYELTGARWARRRLQARAARGLSRFVGRDSELGQLRRALDQATAGHGHVVAVVGEPGVGKSRLFHELTHSPDTRDCLVLEAGSVSYGQATPYLPLIDLLTAYFQIDVNDEARKVREKVTGKLMTLDESLTSTLPVFLALLDAGQANPQWEGLDPAQRRGRTLDAVKLLLLRESRVQPVIVVVEDLHWTDSETQALLDSLVDALPTERILLLVNYRPEYRPAWSAKSYYTQLPIQSLPPDGAEDLLRALLGDDAGLESLKRVVIDRTDGNPFFLEESVRTLVETKALIGQSGAYRLAKTSLSVQVPATIQAVIAARIDRLPHEDKRLLQYAAVIGKDVAFDLLRAIADLPEDGLRRGMAELRAAEFVYETRLFPALEYTFKHALTQEVAYTGLLRDRRRAVHASIMAAMEQLYRDRLGEHAERLAQHAFRGEQWDKAVTYYQQAATRAMSHSAYREAVGCQEQALAALHRLPESRQTREHGIDLRSDLRAALFPLGEFGKLLGYLGEAEALARALDDRRRLGWISAFMMVALWITGDSIEALACGRDARALADSIGDPALQAVVNTHIGLAWTTRGNYRKAEEYLRTVPQLLVGELSRKRLGRAGFPSVLARCFLTTGLADRGEFDAGIAIGEEGLQIARSLDHSWPLILAWWSLGYLHGIRGQLTEAVHLLERCITLAREGNVPFCTAIVSWFLGRTYAFSGRVADGLALLQAGLADMEAMALSPYRAIALVHEGEVLLLAGRPTEAAARAERALLLAQQREERGHQALALRLLGDIGSRQEPPAGDCAEGHYRDAAALATELTMRPLVAHCELGLARLRRRAGRRDEAGEHLATAITMFRDMNMRFWLEQALAEGD